MESRASKVLKRILAILIIFGIYYVVATAISTLYCMSNGKESPNPKIFNQVCEKIMAAPQNTVQILLMIVGAAMLIALLICATREKRKSGHNLIIGLVICALTGVPGMIVGAKINQDSNDNKFLFITLIVVIALIVGIWNAILFGLKGVLYTVLQGGSAICVTGITYVVAYAVFAIFIIAAAFIVMLSVAFGRTSFDGL